MPSRTKIWMGFALALVIVQGAVSVALSSSYALSLVTDALQCVLLASGTLALWPNVRAAQGRVRIFWALMMLGVGSWLTYQLLWTYFEVILRQDVPNPFAGDVVLFLHLVPMTGALALQPHVEQDERTTRLGWLDFALLSIWWAYLYVYTVMPWQYVDPIEANYNHSLNVVYLTEKVVFLGGLAIVFTRARGPWRLVYAHWFGASALYACSSYLANWAIARNLYYTGSVYDIPLTASMAWITAVGLMSCRQSSQTVAASQPKRAVWVGRLGMLTVISLPVFALLSALDPSPFPRVRTFRILLTLGVVPLMGTLVFLKQRVLDRELIRLLQVSQESYQGLRRLQAQLLQSEKLASLGQLAGGAAHELNNPLTAMLGYSDLLLASDLPPEQRQVAEKIVQQVRRTRNLVSSLTGFAHPSQPTLSRVDMNSVVKTAVKLSQAQMCALHIQVATRLSEPLPRVIGDSNQLLQFCLEAIKLTSQAMVGTGQTLTLRTRSGDGRVVLELLPNEGDAAGFAEAQSHSVIAGLNQRQAIADCGGQIAAIHHPETGAGVRIDFPAAAPQTPGYASDPGLQVQRAAATRSGGSGA